MEPLYVAGSCTAAISCALTSVFAPRFQTYFLGSLCALTILVSTALQTVHPFVVMACLMAYSSLLNVYICSSKALVNWWVFTMAVGLDLMTQHTWWPFFVGFLGCYAAEFRWQSCTWALMAVPIHFWPFLMLVWVPGGYFLLTWAERLSCHQFWSNKKII